MSKKRKFNKMEELDTPTESLAQEQVKQEVAVEVEEAQALPLVEFDAWYASRKARIPRQHSKEVLWADFKAQGLKKLETMHKFDAALIKYGVKF